MRSFLAGLVAGLVLAGALGGPKWTRPRALAEPRAVEPAQELPEQGQGREWRTEQHLSDVKKILADQAKAKKDVADAIRDLTKAVRCK